LVRDEGHHPDAVDNKVKLAGCKGNLVKRSAIDREKLQLPKARRVVTRAEYVNPWDLMKRSVRGDHVGRMTNSSRWVIDSNCDDGVAVVILDPNVEAERLPAIAASRHHS